MYFIIIKEKNKRNYCTVPLRHNIQMLHIKIAQNTKIRHQILTAMGQYKRMCPSSIYRLRHMFISRAVSSVARCHSVEGEWCKFTSSLTRRNIWHSDGCEEVDESLLYFPGGLQLFILGVHSRLWWWCVWCRLDMHTLIYTRTRKDWCDRWLQETAVGHLAGGTGVQAGCWGFMFMCWGCPNRPILCFCFLCSVICQNKHKHNIYLFKINISHLLVASPTHQACILCIRLCEFVLHFLYLQLLIIV